MTQYYRNGTGHSKTDTLDCSLEPFVHNEPNKTGTARIQNIANAYRMIACVGNRAVERPTTILRFRESVEAILFHGENEKCF